MENKVPTQRTLTIRETTVALCGQSMEGEK